MRVLLLVVVGCLSACFFKPAVVDHGLVREQFEMAGGGWGRTDYRAERALVRFVQRDIVSNIGLMIGTQIYKVDGELIGGDAPLRFECRNRASETREVGHVLPEATFGCYSTFSDTRFVLAFDDRCAGGVLQTDAEDYRLERWRHDRYGWQEGFYVVDESGSLRAALSWSFGGDDLAGVYVDPTLSERERDVMAVARGVLLAMRDAEDVWVMCGTLGSVSERL